MREKGFAPILVFFGLSIAVLIVLGGIWYLKKPLFQRPLAEKISQISPAQQQRSWVLLDHTNKVSFKKELDESTFLDMQYNGSYWLLGRGYSSYSPNHFYKYSQKEGFINLSSEISNLDEVWHMAWNGQYWLLGNTNYAFTKSQIVKFDGEKYTNLTEQFRQANCESSYQDHVSISNIFPLKSSFLIVNLTDLNSCYVMFDGSKFQNISNIFPERPPETGFDGKRIHYNIGDCRYDICYLSDEGGGDHVLRFILNGNKLEKISLSDLTGAEVKNAIISKIKSNDKGIWLFQIVSFDPSNKSISNLFISYDTTNNTYKKLIQNKVSTDRSRTTILEGWDNLLSKWVISNHECSDANKELCRLVLNHLDGSNLVKLPVTFPESLDQPRISISHGDYFISYKDKLFEVLYGD